MKHEFYVTLLDLKLMVETIEKMPCENTTDNVMITHENTGIGYNLYVTKHIDINGVKGDFKVKITDPQDW